jgi:hypothetical protein
MPAMTESRFGLAAAVAPMAPTVLVVAAAILLPHGFGNALPFAIIFSVPTSYLGFFLVGLPLIHLLKRKGYLNFSTLAIAGIAAGIVAFAGFSVVFGLMLGSRSSYGAVGAAWGAGFGLLVAIVFGLVAGITRRSSRRYVLTSTTRSQT